MVDCLGQPRTCSRPAQACRQALFALSCESICKPSSDALLCFDHLRVHLCRLRPPRERVTHTGMLQLHVLTLVTMTHNCRRHLAASQLQACGVLSASALVKLADNGRYGMAPAIDEAWLGSMPEGLNMTKSCRWARTVALVLSVRGNHTCFSVHAHASRNFRSGGG